MKLSWKLFFITTPVMILALTFFGMWLIHATFSDSLEKEIAQCSLENQYAATSYILAHRAYEDTLAGRFTEEDVVGGFHEAGSEQEGCLRIYDAGGEVIYEDNGLAIPNRVRERLDERHNFGYEICETRGEYYVAALSRAENGVTVETLHRVTDIFRDRDQLSETYRLGLLIASLCMGVVIWAVMNLSLRKTAELSRVARTLASGDLGIRVRAEGSDEIGMLARDFNSMADTMAEQMERLKEEAARKERFTSAFAHELKTPLTSIIGYSEMMATMDLSPGEIRMCGDYINRQSKRLQSLSYKLLGMSLMEKQKIELGPIRCTELARQVEAVEKALVRKRGMVWRMDVAEGWITGDRDLLQSLFLNLIDNGVKASSPGGVILFFGRPEGDGYAFAVADQGTGVAKEELSRLTEAFYMVDKSRSRKEGGAGLGLTLCQEIAKLHGAAMTFDSDLGKGMRICVRFPKAERTGRRDGG
ncbi:MAG: HAMP domain-containing histidine kinase [Lachnospiraceae bacterium]|jgi:signal transduction histidine kinase|nr:HAMP domain-containing histidine kinase [Lachnospiraceae bacterium]